MGEEKLDNASKGDLECGGETIVCLRKSFYIICLLSCFIPYLALHLGTCASHLAAETTFHSSLA